MSSQFFLDITRMSYSNEINFPLALLLYFYSVISYGFAHLTTVSPPATPDDLHIHPIDGKRRNFKVDFGIFQKYFAKF